MGNPCLLWFRLEIVSLGGFVDGTNTGHGCRSVDVAIIELQTSDHFSAKHRLANG